ncbi:1,4-alpha-glucan branching enzyme [Dehalogenimonas lykanthroporepellens BL-DC-9]|jgi:1,4-alpha-glucan branching enzyme|nr:1,4-alpha-glucan branching enzyme [Dehalogenimonas lykanthroporepellens BL-DC-9]
MNLPADKAFHDISLFGDVDYHLFNEGTHYRLKDKLGAHPAVRLGTPGWLFSVWAPAARDVSVIGEFNAWRPGVHRLSRRGDSGIWEGFIPGIGCGVRYKYHLVPETPGRPFDKADPMALSAETPPATASRTWQSAYSWQDGDWMKERWNRNRLDAPVSIYELHPGSWKRGAGDRLLNYRELAVLLVDYIGKTGFTHVELLPVMEHPFYGSWGYQITGYFAPTSRYGNPDDLKYLIDTLHQNGIGVILDWVPSHFPDDAHGLFRFDGTALYEHPDPRRGFHPDWDSCIFDYGRPEVRSFLISNALYWLDEFHADGLRVDGVASMLYLDYSRAPGQWQPNRKGGRENLEAMEFIRRLNTEIYHRFPDVMSIAEESTAWPLVSRPVHGGGLGFGLKWDMGWMHDTLDYFSRDPLQRSQHHEKLTFRSMYAFAENYVLPLSHDEVVHGKSALLAKMPGDDWQKFANLRLLYTYMWTLPGKKLLFMGGEFGQWDEWQHDGSLDWRLLENDRHRSLSAMVEELNRLYRRLPALHRFDHAPEGFTWLLPDDRARSVIAYRRSGQQPEDQAIIVLNLTPVPRPDYFVPLPEDGDWRIVFSSDNHRFGGTGRPEYSRISGSGNTPASQSGVSLHLPPLGGIVLIPDS